MHFVTVRIDLTHIICYEFPALVYGTFKRGRVGF